MTKIDQRLLAKWNKKLAESGLDDIEVSSSYLKRCTWNLGDNFSHANEQYYIYCRQYLFDGEFESPTEKRVWGLHSEGLSYDSIIKQIPFWTSRSPVQRIIRKHKTIMLDEYI